MSTVTDNETKRNIGANMLRFMAELGLSQNALAHEIGESPTRINQYAQAKKMPGAGVLHRICERLGRSLDEITSPPPRNGRGESGRKKSA